jgi:hypothetical protein
MLVDPSGETRTRANAADGDTMSHINIGRWQILYWPRWTLWFVRRNYSFYQCIVYVWPLEFRRFKAQTETP